MMKWFFTTLSLLVAAQAAPNLRASKNSVPQVHRALDNRIINGEESDEEWFPYYVRLLDGFLCGGTLIAPQVVLYAAHCDFIEEGKSQLQVGAYEISSNGHGETRTCDRVVPHPNYSGMNNDFALCLLNEPVTISKDFVELDINDKDGVPKEGEDLITLGLGVTEEGGLAQKLRNVTVPAISNQVCNQPDYYGGYITDSMLCAGFAQGQKDSCQGDSGGPIVKRKFVDGKFVDVHVGVVSWGSGCAEPKKPGVYARTSSAHGWIKNTVCDSFKADAKFCGTTKPDVECKDKKTKIKGKKNGCKNYVAKGKKKLIKKKCNKKKKGKKIYTLCPKTCGEVGLGECAN